MINVQDADWCAADVARGSGGAPNRDSCGPCDDGTACGDGCGSPPYPLVNNTIRTQRGDGLGCGDAGDSDGNGMGSPEFDDWVWNQ